MLQPKAKRLLVRDVNDVITCSLCKGYFIEAASIIECFHTFCRSCLVKHLELNKFCPKCEVVLPKANPLTSVRCDPTKQKLVYKLVPGLYADEMNRRRKYYEELGGPVSEDGPYSHENKYFSPDDSISLSLEHISVENGDEENSTQPEKQQLLHRRYLQCPAAVNMSHLKKFIRMKYDLRLTFMVDIIYDGECLPDDFSLIDVAYTFNWNRNSPMKFKYKISDRSAKRPPKANKTKKAIVTPPEDSQLLPASRKRGLATVIRQQDQEPPAKQNVQSKAPEVKKMEPALEERIVEKEKHQKRVKEEEKELSKKEKKKEKEKERLAEEEKKEEIKKISREPDNRRGEKSVEIRDNIRELVCKGSTNPVLRLDKKKLSVTESELEPERKRSRADSHVMDEEHDADDEDDERAVMTDEPVVERKEHSSKKSDRKEKKKSKKQKHHHHHHHRHHDKKKDPPQTATILYKPGNDMKLKVKLTAIKSDSNSKVTKYSVVEDFEDRKETLPAPPVYPEKTKEEPVKEKPEKVKSSSKMPEDVPAKKVEPPKKPDHEPVKTTISLNNHKVMSNAYSKTPASSVTTSITNNVTTTTQPPVTTSVTASVTTPSIKESTPTPPTQPIKQLVKPTVKPTVSEPINNNTINSDKESAVNVYENNKLSLSRKLLNQTSAEIAPAVQAKVNTQIMNNPVVKPQLNNGNNMPCLSSNNMVNNNNINTTNNNTNVTPQTKHSISGNVLTSSPPPLKPKSESVKLITGEAAKERLIQMRAVRHKAMPKVNEPLKMPPSSITVSKITAEEKRQMEQAKLLAARQAQEDESKRPSLEIMLVNGPPSKDKEKEKEKKEEVKEKEDPPPQPPPQPKKIVRPPPPSIPLSQINKSRWGQKPLLAAQEVLDLSGKSSRKSPDVGGMSDKPQAMRNLMTLSDTAAQIRNIIQEEIKIPLVGGKPTTFTPQPQQRQLVKPNQNVRHIPNPSVLAFRYNGAPVPPQPVLPLRKMESMTRSIEQVAAGLNLKAAYAAK